MDAPQPPLRPRSLALTVACAVAFLAALQAFAFAYGPDFRQLTAATRAPWLPRFIVGSSFVAIVFLVALWWRMRRWALWGYLAVVLVQNVVMARLGSWGPAMLVFPVVVGAASAWTWDRLR
jgi:hypothetical protein